jgi:hypothetical protein
MIAAASHRSRFLTLVRDHPWFGLLLVLVALVSAACGSLRFSGDEAPIRVKGGSIDLELLNGSRTWKPNGTDGMKWKTQGTRDHADYKLTFAAKPGACNVSGDRKTTVRITYNDNHWVEFTAQGQHTAVTSDVRLQTSADERTLSYAVSSGYISAISLDGQLVCAFASKSEFTSLDAED